MSTVDQYLVWPIFHMMCVHHPTMILHTGMVFCVTNIYTGYHNNDGVQLKFYGNGLQKNNRRMREERFDKCFSNEILRG